MSLPGRRATLADVHPHTLRHSCGFAVADKGHDLRLIRDYPDHRDLRHTVHYTSTASRRPQGLWLRARRPPTTSGPDQVDRLRRVAGPGEGRHGRAPAMEAFGLTFEEIDDALGGGWAGTL